MQAHLFIAMFVSVQVWTFNIHDNLFLTANDYINGAAHHAIHHLEFNYNYGQYFTLWDRLFGTHRFPTGEAKVKEYFAKAFALGAKRSKTSIAEAPLALDSSALAKSAIKRNIARAAE
ncbi:MAG: hypothetical protein SGCHY_002202 [Lobulomycetales sp.]